MPRGGKRQGAPGKAYGQRTDMNQNRQPVQVAAGQAYGKRQAQEQAQRAVPLPAAPPVQVPPPSPAPGASPGSFGDFARPTERPDEPLTAGLPIGPGAGPEAVRAPIGISEDDALIAELRGLYSAFPSSQVAQLLAFAEQQREAKGGAGQYFPPVEARPLERGTRESDWASEVRMSRSSAPRALGGM